MHFYYKAGWQTPGDPAAEWGFKGDASRTYQFKLNPKWIYEDGRTMYLIWSDAGGRWDGGNHGHSSYWYRWNQMKITIDVAGGTQHPLKNEQSALAGSWRDDVRHSMQAGLRHVIPPSNLLIAAAQGFRWARDSLSLGCIGFVLRWRGKVLTGRGIMILHNL